MNILATVIQYDLLGLKIHILDTKWNNKWYFDLVCIIDYCFRAILFPINFLADSRYTVSIYDVTHLGGRAICKKVTLLYKPI